MYIYKMYLVHHKLNIFVAQNTVQNKNVIFQYKK